MTNDWIKVAALVASVSPAAADVPVLQLPPSLEPRAAETTQIDVVVRPNLRHTRNLPRGLRAARKAMIEDDPVDPQVLRRIADYNDGLAAWRYVRHLREAGDAQPEDLAHYAAVAAGTGRGYALKTMIEAMRRIEPGAIPSSRVNFLISTLYPYAWEGDRAALAAVAEFNGEGRLFGPLSQRTRDRLLEHADAFDGRLELEIAMRALKDPEADPAALQNAAQLLMRARSSAVPGIAAAAQNMLPLLHARAAAADS